MQFQLLGVVYLLLIGVVGHGSFFFGSCGTLESIGGTGTCSVRILHWPTVLRDFSSGEDLQLSHFRSAVRQHGEFPSSGGMKAS